MGEKKIISVSSREGRRRRSPLGPAIGPLGVNVLAGRQRDQQVTADFKGMKVPVKVEVDQETKKFTVSVGTPTTSALLVKEAAIPKGSGKPNLDFVGNVSFDKVLGIAKIKINDSYAKSIKSSVKEVVGSCVSLGLKVEDDRPTAVHEADRGRQVGQGHSRLRSEEIKPAPDTRGTMSLGRVAEIWRYPVNGLQGEKLEESRVLTTGISGDHLYAIRDTRTNRILDPKSHHFSWGESLGHPAMLEFAARLSGDPEGEHDVSIETSGQTICTSMDRADEPAGSAPPLGADVELVRYPRIAESRVRSGRTLHLLTTSSLAATDKDLSRRRLRRQEIPTEHRRGHGAGCWRVSSEDGVGGQGH